MVELINGIVADNAALPTDQVRVSAPNLTQMDRITYGPLPVLPKVNAAGGVILPQRGDRAIIAVDDNSATTPWIIQWAPAS